MTGRLLTIVVTLAALSVAAAPAGASGRVALTWSGPKLIDHGPPFGDPAGVNGVSCASPNFCLATGSQGTVVMVTPSGHRVTTGVDHAATLGDVACPSASLCVVLESNAVLTTTNPTAARPTWTRTRLALSGPEQLTGVTCASNTLCVAWADSGTVQVTTDPTGPASAWKPTTLAPDSSGETVKSVGCTPQASLCVASLTGAGGSTAQYATTINPAGGAGAWTETTAPGTESVNRIACPTTSLCVGINGHTIETSTNPTAGASSWTSGTVLPATATSVALQGIACPSDTRCVAAVSDGSIASSTTPATGAASYTVSAVLDPTGFGTANVNGMACPTDRSCLIPDRNAGLATVTLSDPPTATFADNLAGVSAITGLSCASPALCVAVDDAGAILRSAQPTGAASTWHRAAVQPAASQGLNAVSCPATGFCATVGQQDEVGNSSRPGSGAPWRFAQLPFSYEPGNGGGPTRYDLTSISCSSFRLCVAGNSEFGLMVSTHPGGGASAWKFLPIGAFNADSFDAVSCPTKSFCVAGEANFGRVAVSTRPASTGSAWRFQKIASGVGSLAPAISSVSCSSPTFCLAADASGAVHTTSRPTRGAGAWKRVKIASSRLTGAWCRSRGLCVVIDSRGHAWASTQPAGNRSAWHSVTLKTTGYPIATTSQGRPRTVSCAKTKVCLAGSGDGLAWSGR